MSRSYFQQHLRRFRELGAGFAGANPALAQFLGRPQADPDVERMLDAVVFHNALLTQRLKLDFMEYVQGVANHILPHYLKEVPAAAVAAFAQDPLQAEAVTIPAGTQLASAPVDGTSCLFSTAWDVEVHPLELRDALLEQQTGRAVGIRLWFKLHGVSLSQWKPGRMCVFLAGDHVSAADTLRLLSLTLKRIVLSSGDGTAVSLPSSCLRPMGFDESEALLSCPSHAFPGYRLLQEYFNFPEKFLFFELDGWEQWENRGDGTEFSVVFELDEPSLRLPRIGRDSFALHCVPIVNAFPHYADPICLDHRRSRYLVRPSGPNQDHYQVLSVDRVTGVSPNTGLERPYQAFELFGCESPEEPVFHASLEKSSVRSGHDAYIGVAFPELSSLPDREILSLELSCSNGTLPGNLRIGDIRFPVSSIPGTVTFRNITPVSRAVSPTTGPDLLRRLHTHLYLNQVTLMDANNLRTLLELYLPHGGPLDGPAAANLKRVSGIEEVEVAVKERFLAGVPVDVREILMKVRQDRFAGAGDLYLFGCVLDHFFGGYAAVKTFIRLSFQETLRGERLQWPIRLGRKQLT